MPAPPTRAAIAPPRMETLTFVRRAASRLLVFLLAIVSLRAGESGWKAGVATADITPREPQWMAGYGGRTKPAEGALHPLFLKVLALEDARGHRAIILSSDLLGITQPIYEQACAMLQERFGLGRAQVMLNASHTHCGPVLTGALRDAHPVNDAQKEVIHRYSAELTRTIVETSAKALGSLAPARLAAGQGLTRFAVNRRNNPEGSVPKLIAENALKGPVDHSVPVLTVTTANGALKAVVFGYACHNTVLSFYQWAGDYAGFAQLALERSHPGATALFFSGCGADQNPLPRRQVAQAERYGHMLAAAVEEVLLQAPAVLAPTLVTSHELVTLKFGAAPTVAELEAMAVVPPGTQEAGPHRWAKRLLAEARAGKTWPRTYPYPIQAWLLGGRQLWLTLGGEPVVDYALRFKREFGADSWVTGYSNDVMAYIPSARVLAEDKPPRPPGRAGYEGNTSMYAYGQPAHAWADDVEDSIAAAMQRLVREVRAK